MKALVRFYTYLNILSIDVALGAVICAVFFANILNVSILPYGLCALALTVWVIYTADHLRDAMLITGEAASARHQFHQQKKVLLGAAMGVAIVVNLVLLFYIRRELLFAGLLLAAAVVVYLLFQRRFFYGKEIFVSAIYTAGVLLPSLVSTTGWLPAEHILVIIAFFLVALINLYLFSFFDHEHDKRDRLFSFVTLVGIRKARNFLACLFVIFFVVAFCHLLLTGFSLSSLCILCMGSILLLLFLGQVIFTKDDRFRLIGDAVFFIPLIALF